VSKIQTRNTYLSSVAFSHRSPAASPKKEIFFSKTGFLYLTIVTKTEKKIAELRRRSRGSIVAQSEDRKEKDTRGIKKTKPP